VKTQPISLDSIYPCSDNPNSHSESKIATLAANIREFGLINPITVKPTGKGKTFEIVTGHGRFTAFKKLSVESDEWASIPCVIVMDSSDYNDWGRRLSENKIRSFNWVAECIELAGMRNHGKSAVELAEIFGYDEKHLRDLAALGFIPDLVKLFGTDNPSQEPIISVFDARRYLLPLRIWPADIPKNDKALDYSLYDYSEVTAAIDGLVSGRIKPDELGEYSAQRREAISAAQQEQRVKALAARELETLKAELTEKDRAVKKLEKDKEAELKKAQDMATKELEKIKNQHEAALSAAILREKGLKQQLESMGDKDEAIEELRTQLSISETSIDALRAQLNEAVAGIEAVKERVRKEITEQLRAEIWRQLESEVQAKKNEEAEAEIADGLQLLARERESLERVKASLNTRKSALDTREIELKEQRARMKERLSAEAKGEKAQTWATKFTRLLVDISALSRLLDTYKEQVSDADADAIRRNLPEALNHLQKTQEWFS